MALRGSSNSEKIWNFLRDNGFTEFGAAGLLGNIDCESGCNPKNLQDSYERSLGLNDTTYTAAVDNGTYTNFVRDGAGYGITQTTFWSRKQNLLNFAKSKGKSIGDLEMQLEFLMKELNESFHGVLSTLKSAKSVNEASDIVLLKFEVPYNANGQIDKRRSVCKTYYERYATGSVKTNNASTAEQYASLSGYKTFKKGVATRLSEHFYSTEFDCHGSGCCTSTLINMRLIYFLEMIRCHFDKPVTISSGYRCETHNGSKSVGGAYGSRHTKGDACDIVVKDIAPREVAKYCESIGILGIGLYETQADGFFVHIDCRDYKSFWYGKAEARRDTFGGATQPASGSITSTASILGYGSAGSAVKLMQENLIKLGFSCGSAGADGDYGVSTQKAVMAFQKAKGLIADGIAGTQTLRAITAALSQEAKSDSLTYKVRVNAAKLNIRSGAGTNYGIIGTITDRGTYEISSESNGTGASKWGKLSIRDGWVSLDYCSKI